jgi:RNA polymerase primary sigma factor
MKKGSKSTKAEESLQHNKSTSYVSYDSLRKVISADTESSIAMEDQASLLAEEGIEIMHLKHEEDEDGESTALYDVEKEGEEDTEEEESSLQKGEDVIRSDDPVRMYLRDMGDVELLSREGEVLVSKKNRRRAQSNVALFIPNPSSNTHIY